MVGKSLKNNLNFGKLGLNPIECIGLLFLQFHEHFFAVPVQRAGTSMRRLMDFSVHCTHCTHICRYSTRTSAVQVILMVKGTGSKG